MCALDDNFVMVDTDDDEDLGLFPIDDINFSVDTQWYFEGAWLALLSFVDDQYPSITVGDAMASEDNDGHLAVWARFDFGESVMWLRFMTFSPFHWTWGGGVYN